VTSTSRLGLATRATTIALPGYSVGMLLDVVAGGDGPVLTVTVARANGVPDNVLLNAAALRRPAPLGVLVARGDARVIPLTAPQPELSYEGDETSNSAARVDTDRTSTHYRCGEYDCGSSYTAVRVSVAGHLDVGGGWLHLAPRPPQYPAGEVWDLGDWNGDNRTDFLAGTIAGASVFAPTARGVRALPLPELATPSGQRLAFPVALDVDGDHRNDVAGFARRGSQLVLELVSPA
jgi:hypothetical protein